MKRFHGHDVHRRARRLRERYKVEFKTYRDFESVQEAMNILYELHEKRWRSLNGGQTHFLSARTRAFHNELANMFAARGWLDLNFLTANDEAVAATYCFEYQGKIFAYQSGFDPRFSNYSVGTIIFLRDIEESIRRGLGEFDMLRGAELYKSQSSTHLRRNLSIGFVRRGFFAHTLWAAEEQKRRLAHFLRRSEALADDSNVS